MGRKRSRRRKAAGGQVSALPPPVSPPPPPATSPTPNPGGRPSKYTPEVVARICTLLRKGMPRVRAARRAGIHPDTFCTWMKAFPEFSERVHDAEDEWVEKAMGKVTDLVDSKNERVALAAAKFGLSSRFREDFAKRTEQTGPDGGPVQHEHSGSVETTLPPLVTLEDLRKMNRAETEAALLAEAERQDQANREEETE